MSTIINGTSSAITFPDTTVQNTAFTTGAVTQSAIATGVAGTGPAFSAYQSSSQTIATGTWTKAQFQAETFDTANCFDSTTNYRFTPNVAGYYQVNGLVWFNMTSSWAAIELYKNGTPVQYGLNLNGTPNGLGVSFNSLIYLNGSTDYIELYVYQGSGSNQTTAATAIFSNFSASMVRAA